MSKKVVLTVSAACALLFFLFTGRIPVTSGSTRTTYRLGLLPANKWGFGIEPGPAIAIADLEKQPDGRERIVPKTVAGYQRRLGFFFLDVSQVIRRDR